MAWSSKRPFLFRVACGFVAGASAVTGASWVYGNTGVIKTKTALSYENPYAQNNSPLGKVIASWTTNFKPSVEWDANWDRLVRLYY